MVFGSLLCAPAANADTVETDAVSAAHGHGIFVEGLGLDVVGSATANSDFPDNVGPGGNDIDVELLGALGLNLGSLNLPLIKSSDSQPGLLDLGNLGALSSYAASESETKSTASSGILGADGALNVDGDPGNSSDPSKLNLTDLLSQVLSDELIDTVLDDASITIGALGSTATEDAGTVTSSYGVADLQANISSPLVGTLATEVNDTLETVIGPVTGLLSSGGAIETLVAGVVDGIGALPLVNAEVNDLSIDTEPLLTSVRTELLAKPLTNTDGSVSVNLADGTISVDLAKLIVDSQGATDLNSLDPNTSVLSGAVVTSILDGVTDALTGNGENSLVTKVVNVVTDGIYDLELNVDIQADISLPLVGALVDAPVTVKGTLGGFLGQTGHDEPVVDTSKINVAGIPAGTVLQPIINLLTGLVSSIGSALEPVVNGVIANVAPTLTTAVGSVIEPLLDDALDPVLRNLVAITINEQPAVGDLGTDSFTVRALSVDVLPGTANVGVDLGSSSVKALDEAPADAAVDILTPTEGQEVPAGAVVVTGKGEPNAELQVAIDGQTPVTVNVDGDGNWTYTFPDVAAGPHNVTATDGTTNDEVSFTAEDAATVAVDILTPTEGQEIPAGDVVVTGKGEPNVVLQVAIDGQTPVDVTVDADGNWTHTFPDVTAGPHKVIATDGTTNDEVNFTSAENTDVNTADNTAENTADNAAENTAENTADNAAENTADNAAENTADNAAENTADNAAENTDVNTADNAAENTDVNTAENTAENTADNAAENTDVNTADNAAENTDVNTADNAAENTDVNTAENTADNAAENTADNAAENTADNGTDNTADNTADNTEHPTLTVLPNSVEAGDDVTVIGDKFVPGGPVEFRVKNVNGEGDPVLDLKLSADDEGRFQHEFSTEGLPEGIYIIEVTDPESGKTYNEYFEVKPSDEVPLDVAVDITPNRLIKGESGEVTAKGFTPGGTVSVQQSALGATEKAMARAMAAALPPEVTADDAGDISFMVDTTDIELGNYILILTDAETGSYAFTTFTVVEAENAADNTADNTADNAAENTDANTADNAAENGSDNGAENGADNAAENGSDNGAENGADNAAENGSDNGADNAAENGSDNGADNAAENGSDNGAENSADNKTENGSDNGNGSKDKDSKSDKLADTGSNGALVLGAGAFLLVLLGIGARVIARKRKA